MSIATILFICQCKKVLLVCIHYGAIISFNSPAWIPFVLNWYTFLLLIQKPFHREVFFVELATDASWTIYGDPTRKESYFHFGKVYLLSVFAHLHLYPFQVKQNADIFLYQWKSTLYFVPCKQQLWAAFNVDKRSYISLPAYD